MLEARDQVSHRVVRDGLGFLGQGLRLREGAFIDRFLLGLLPPLPLFARDVVELVVVSCGGSLLGGAEACAMSR